jgi:hypothetical protein
MTFKSFATQIKPFLLSDYFDIVGFYFLGHLGGHLFGLLISAESKRTREN